MSSAQALSAVSNTSPTPASLLEAARKLVPQIRAAADDFEKNRELSRTITDAIADAGIFLMSTPRDAGGHEVDLPTHVRIIETLAGADASAGWSVNQGSTFGWYASRMKTEAARPVWADTPRAVVANSPVPTGKAIVVPGGFRVSSKQGFSTGCKHATWLAAHTQVIENGEVRRLNGQPETRYCLVPKAEGAVHDTWHTRGMRGTGTHTIEVKDVFVPEDRTVLSGYTKAPQLCGGIRYAIPLTLNFAMGDGAAALALARNCMTAFCELAGAKAPRHMPGMLRDQGISQFAVGEAEAELRSGRAFLMETVEELWEDTVSNGAPSMEKRAHARLASIHAIRTAAKVIDRLHPLCGGDALFEGGAIQRYFQDIHVITQHVQGRLLNYELVGKFKLGVLTEDPRI